MNDERRPARNAAANSTASDNSPRGGRDVPRAFLVIPFEGSIRLDIHAETLDDELRFRGWLREALKRRRSISDYLDEWLDRLDARDAA